MIIAVLIVAFLFRRAFCGQICTLGSIQEFFANIGKKIFKKNFFIPFKVDKPLRYLKYLILAIIVIWQSIVTYKLIQVGTPTEIQRVTTATGQFQWTQPTLKTKVKSTGFFNPTLIKGSSTFKEISEASGVPKEAILERFKITEKDFNLAIKDVKAKYGFETEDVRTFIKEYLEKNKK